MKIGYRRVSGKLPLTDNETGQRGTWLEKRRALILNLELRGHKFAWLSPLTTASTEAGHKQEAYTSCDVLMLEFGGNNLLFNGKAWNETFEMIKTHKGKVIFLCDDPDLPFLWKELPGEDWTRWFVAVNATKLEPTRLKLGVPSAAKMIDLPFHALLDQQEFSDGTQPTAIYYGRPNGRMKSLTPYLQSGALTIAGRIEEWNDPSLSIVEPPQQRDRANWYKQWRACFAMYDGKHAITGWRTGRAYHALLAGIPVAAPIGNPALNWAYGVTSPRELASLLRLSREQREAIHARQVQSSNAYMLLNLSLATMGL
jgi:hypothetical protein